MELGGRRFRGVVYRLQEAGDIASVFLGRASAPGSLGDFRQVRPGDGLPLPGECRYLGWCAKFYVHVRMVALR